MLYLQYLDLCHVFERKPTCIRVDVVVDPSLASLRHIDIYLNLYIARSYLDPPTANRLTRPRYLVLLPFPYLNIAATRREKKAGK